MFYHRLLEPISLVASHMTHNMVAILSSKCKLSLVDLKKNRTIKRVDLLDFIKELSKSSTNPIGLFFVDTTTSNLFQNLYKLDGKSLIMEYYISIVFSRGIVLISQSFEAPVWKPFDDRIMTMVTQNHEGFLLADKRNALYRYSLVNYQLSMFYILKESPLFLYYTCKSTDRFDVFAFSSGSAEIIEVDGEKLSYRRFSINIKCDSYVFDPFTYLAYGISQNRTVTVFHVKPPELRSIHKMHFWDGKSNKTDTTNFKVQAVCPCFLPYSSKPLYLAYCKDNNLILCNLNHRVYHFGNFPGFKLTNFNPHVLIPSLVDYRTVIAVSRDSLILIDLVAYLPAVVPSQSIPSDLRNIYANHIGADGLYKVLIGRRTILIFNYISHKFAFFNRRDTTAPKQTGDALDVVISEDDKLAYVECALKQGKEKYTLRCFDDNGAQTTFDIVLNDAHKHFVRLASFGCLFGVIFSLHELDMNVFPQITPSLRTFIYSWNFSGIPMNVFNVTSGTGNTRFIVLISPHCYTILKRESDKFVEIVRRHLNVIDAKINDNIVFLLTSDGLYVDDTHHMFLFRTKSSYTDHDVSIDLNSQYIKYASKRAGIKILTNLGNENSFGFPNIQSLYTKYNVPHVLDTKSISEYLLNKDSWITIEEKILKKYENKIKIPKEEFLAFKKGANSVKSPKSKASDV